TIITVDNFGNRFVQSVFGNMTLIDPGNLIPPNVSHRLRRLTRTEKATIGKDSRKIPLHGVIKFGLVTGEWPKVTRPVEPSFSVCQYIQQVDGSHLLTH